MISQLNKPLTTILLALLLVTPLYASELKPIMKEMRLHYKQAIDASSAEAFNQKIQLFLLELKKARAYDFPNEQARLSLEGLDKVHDKVSAIPQATDINLATVKQQLKQVDSLRKEYHKKVKPGVFELLIKTFKQLF